MIVDTNNKQIDLPRIVICGSMSHYEVMLSCRNELSKNKIPSIVPENEFPFTKNSSKEIYLNIKRELSRQWLLEITNPRTYGILVVNNSKEDMDNYIGPNSFAEIAVAFAMYKQIFLLHDLYSPYEDELLAWRVLPLLGHLEGLISAYWETNLETKVADS